MPSKDKRNQKYLKYVIQRFVYEELKDASLAIPQSVIKECIKKGLENACTHLETLFKQDEEKYYFVPEFVLHIRSQC